jgi:hypothetical protein
VKRKTVAVEVPPHVTVHPVKAAFCVECAHCRAQGRPYAEWAYHVEVMANPGWIAAAVEAHRNCGGEGGDGRESALHPLSR